MTNKKIVGMISSYKGLKPSPVDWLWKQTPHPCGVWGNIQMMASAPKPDFLLLYNFNDFTSPNPQQRRFRNLLKSFRTEPETNQPNIQAKLRGVPQERIVALVREPPFPKMQQHRITVYQQAQQYCGYVSGPDEFAPTPDYMPRVKWSASSCQLRMLRPCSTTYLHKVRARGTHRHCPKSLRAW
ncbi:MAG: hypothetical protein F6K47_24815, partial [Symploca sp. SIO2E6]|nr:hypothetical protein [Symploca sp. SIO2E6]